MVEMVVVVEIQKAAPKIQKRVNEAVQVGTCLECRERSMEKRGLCSRCYQRWYLVRVRLAPSRQASFDARLIRLGKLLPQQGARRIKQNNSFAIAARGE